MKPIVSTRSVLRAATESHHQKVDTIFSGAVLSDRGSYGRFLQAQAAAYFPVEALLSRAGISAIVPDWPRRQRSALLRQDLIMLGIDVPEPAGTLAVEDNAGLLGALYVLEGSRLGGALLKRAVPPDFPARFLGGADASAWKSLLELLDLHLDTDPKRATAISAACLVFALFEASGRRYLS